MPRKLVESIDLEEILKLAKEIYHPNFFRLIKKYNLKVKKYALNKRNGNIFKY